MAVAPLILVANPGSASRKYALFAGRERRGEVHFEFEDGRIVCGVNGQRVEAHVDNLADAPRHVVSLLREHSLLKSSEVIARAGLRIVAPSSYFLSHKLIDDETVRRLEALLPRAPLHITATLAELKILREVLTGVPIVGVSDSAFHITKPDYAWNYGLPLADADVFEIKRFGYHGLSVQSVVETLHGSDRKAPKLIVAHLGSGASVTAVHGGKSLDTTMGYSPLEGLVMSTRSGSIDPTAAAALKSALHFDDAQLDTYLNTQSGLRGLGGSDDIRELLQREAGGDHLAHLALSTYVYNAQKAIGAMVAALGGADVLVFTGTVGMRSAPMRARIVERLHYLEFTLDTDTNLACTEPAKLTTISKLVHSKPVFAVPTDEAQMIARAAADAHIE